MARNKTGIIIGILLLALACKKETEDPVDFKYDYAPVTTGHYCVYDVTEIHHDHVAGVHDTVQYKIKEKIESTYVDNEGRPSLRLERYRQDTAGGAWYISDVWNATRSNVRYEKVEEDERFIRLTFPVKESAGWNGNAFNQQEEWDYEYTDVDVPRIYNGLSFLQTARVLQIDEFNFVQKHKAFEVYAKNVGLVYKYYKYLDIYSGDSTQARLGDELYMQITNYGVE